MRRGFLILSTFTTLSSRAFATVRCLNPSLSLKLNIPLSTDSAFGDSILQQSELNNALEILDPAVSDRPFSIDFCTKSVAERLRGSRGELVVKALGHADRLIDLTAGLGRDAVILAASGNFKHVLMVERNVILYHLLDDALQRLKICNPSLAERIQTLMHGDASLSSTADHLMAPDTSTAVYLDPMYPDNTVGRRSMVKKETQILHRLNDDKTLPSEKINNAALFATAKRLATSRIVVKRPKAAPPIDISEGPSFSIDGSTQRFDVYLQTMKQV